MGKYGPRLAEGHIADIGPRLAEGPYLPYGPSTGAINLLSPE